MMELKYLHKTSSRLTLWRNTIQLFHEYKRPSFVGPFKAAGLKYIIERLFLTTDYDEKKPDIVASGKAGWIMIELTTSSKSKKAKLDEYRKIEPNYLSGYGLEVHKTEATVFSSRLSFVDDGPYCQIIVKDVLKILKDDCIIDQNLRKKLIKMSGKDLRKLPEIPISLIPEMSSSEIRLGLIHIVIKLFEPGNQGISLGEIVDEGLERLADKVSVTEKRSLMDKVQNQMDVLIRNHLNDYIEFKEKRYRATDKFKQHHKTMEFISSKVKEWVGEDIDQTLDRYC